MSDDVKELTEEDLDRMAAEGIDVMNSIGEVLRQRVKRAEARHVENVGDPRASEKLSRARRELAGYINMINLCCHLQNENLLLQARCQTLEDILGSQVQEEIPILFEIDPEKAN